MNIVRGDNIHGGHYSLRHRTYCNLGARKKINSNVVWRLNNSFKNSLRSRLALKLEWRLLIWVFLHAQLSVLVPVWKGGPMSGSDFFVEFRSVIRVRCVYRIYHLFIKVPAHCVGGGRGWDTKTTPKPHQKHQ